MARPNTTTIHQPSSRTMPSDYWTPDLIRAAEVMADSGSLRLAAELVDALLVDDRVMSCLLLLTRGFFGLELTFIDGTGLRRRRAMKALQADEDWWQALPEVELAKLVSWGIVLGVGLARLQWTRANGRLVPVLEHWHPKNLRFDTHSRTWWVCTRDGEIEITPGDGQWVMYCPYGQETPWSSAVWKALSRWWLLKKYAIGDWGRHGEQATGIKVATTESGNEADRRRLANDLATLGKDAAVALPAGWDLKLVEIAANTFETFKAQTEAANTAIATALVGQNLTSEVKGGSFAAAQVHQSIANAILRGQGEALSTTLHFQVLRWWAQFNFGSPDVAPWPAWNTDPPEDQAAVAGTAKMLGDAITSLKTAGVPVDERAMAERFRLPLLKNVPALTVPADKQALSGVDPLPRRAVTSQAYIDDLVQDTAPMVQKAMQPTVAKVLSAVANSTSYTDLRAALKEMGELTPAELRAVLADAAELAGLAGQWSAEDPA